MKTQDVRMYTEQRLHWLWALPDNQRRAELAKLPPGAKAIIFVGEDKIPD